MNNYQAALIAAATQVPVASGVETTLKKADEFLKWLYDKDVESYEIKLRMMINSWDRK